MDILDKFLNFLQNNYQSKYTINAYYIDVCQFIDYKKTYVINENDINAYVLFLNKNKKSPSTIKRKLSALSVFYDFLKKSGIYNFDLKGLVRPKSPKPLPKFLDIDETLSFLENVSSLRDKAIISLLYSSALRVSELVNLNIEDINFSNNTILITRKGNKQMSVPVSPKTINILKKYLGNRQKGSVFLNKFGKRLSQRSIENIVKKHAKKTLLKDISPHTLRHSRATHLLNNGMDLRILQRFLGHSSILATQIYTHLSLQDLIKAYDTFHPLNKKD
ncbi:MAG: tyrosine recombinase XerD [Desulfurella sp.]|uniref:site-specific tyrosine recombinase/integron integrase n=1 Tax=Desulfurella sp. TaxID=1962857 RepID=UPI000CB09CA2|nr:site-specific tyrosine recombinase/integron integrase [Desulfurella sp.]PMP92470.1 MAG: tyrosine recombinase XerD [Desulfurella sp.]HEX13177.1 tyrosine recombinase XerD [Desulfurella acetivorans]